MASSLRPGPHPRGRLQHTRAAERKARHLAAARYFEGLGSDELAGALAGHYLAAGRNAPEGPERTPWQGRHGSPFRRQPTAPLTSGRTIRR